MACCWTGDKPLPEPMLTQFIDAYMWHMEDMSQHQGSPDRKNVSVILKHVYENQGKGIFL